jgi:uncharacterized protein YdhG (YjbR/CyaY superfamily)
MTKYSKITDYIEAQPPETARALRELRASILDAAPDAVELFNYGIPAFALVPGGKRDQQIMIAGYAGHVGFYPHPSVIEFFASELAGYKCGKGSVQFPVSRPVPSDLVVRMVLKRLEMLASVEGCGKGNR